MIVFDDPDRFCLVLKGRINTAAPGQRQEVGTGGVIGSSMHAYAIENSELLFINLEKLRELNPDLAAKIAGSMKEKGAGPGWACSQAGENSLCLIVWMSSVLCAGSFQGEQVVRIQTQAT